MAATRRHTLLSAVMLGALVAGSVAPVFGFDPSAEQGHPGISREGLESVRYTTAAGNTIQFTERAILDVRAASTRVDRWEIHKPLAHCDDETLPECSWRMIGLKSKLVANLADDQNRSGGEARASLGRVLHTVHDFYSHSNWIDISGGGANGDLGVRPIPRLSADQRTCADNGFDLDEFGLTNLTSGYFSLLNSIPDGKCAHGVIVRDTVVFDGILRQTVGFHNHFLFRECVAPPVRGRGARGGAYPGRAARRAQLAGVAA